MTTYNLIGNKERTECKINFKRPNPSLIVSPNLFSKID